MTRRQWIFFALIVCLLSLTGCKTVVRYSADLFKPDQSSCWPCQVYMSAFNAFSLALEKSLELICSNTFKVMTLGMAFWLMYKVFPWVLSLSPPNFKEDFVQVIKVLFKFMIVGLLLSHPDSFYTEIGSKVLQPLGMVFLKISELVLVTPNALGIEITQYARTDNTFLSGILGIVNSLRDAVSGAIDWGSALWSNSGISRIVSSLESSMTEVVMPNGETVAMPDSDRMFGPLPMQIQSVIWTVYSSLWSGMGLVFQLFAANSFASFLAAIFLAFALFQLIIFLPLSFIDAFMRLGIGVILMPIFMAIWVFPLKIFEGMGKKLVELVLSAFFDILFNCIYVAFLISVLRVYVSEKIPYIFSTDFQASESGLREAGEHLSMDFLVMTVLVLTVFKLFNQVESIVGRFFDSAGQGTSLTGAIQKMIGVGIATGLAVARVAATAGADWSGFKKVGKEMGGMVKEGMTDMNANQEKQAGEDLWLRKD